MKIENVGNIQLSNKVRVTDPCYNIDTWCAGTLENVLPGEYNCSYMHDDIKLYNGFIYDRVTSIEVHHKDYPDVTATEYMKDIDVRVDSGQAGIFDYMMFHNICADKDKKDDFYDKVSDMTYIKKEVTNKNYIPFNQSQYYDKEFDILECIPEKQVRDTFDMMDSIITYMKENNIKDEILQEKIKYFDLYKRYFNAKFRYSLDINISDKNIKSNVPCGNTIDDKGFVSASGAGDGNYACFVGRNNNGQIVAIKIDYYPDYEKLLNIEDEEKDNEIDK